MGLRQTLLAVRDDYKNARYAGIACAVKNTGIGNGLAEYGRAILRPEADGTVTLYQSWTEMGQGLYTVLAQIVCEQLGLTPDRVRVTTDTERELDGGQTTASRGTVLGGRGVIAAAARLRDRLAELDGPLPGGGGPSRGQLARLAGEEFYGEVVIDWTTAPGADVAEPVTHFAYGWATQVAVLADDGRIAKVIAAHDVGRVINPTLLEGQIEGAVHMGLGHALSEEYVVEDGYPVTTTLKSLNIIPSAWMPGGGMPVRRGEPARGPLRREGRRRDRPGAHRRGGGRGAALVRRDVADRAADEGLGCGPCRRAAAGQDPVVTVAEPAVP